MAEPTSAIELSPGDTAKAWRFAEKFVARTSRKSFLDFGHGQRARGSSDRLGDCVAGKLGEIAFARYAEEVHGHRIRVDFKIARGWLRVDDGQDVARIDGRKPKIRCDVKTSKRNARWLLVEAHKASARVILPDAFVFVRIDLPADLEKRPEQLLGRALKAEVCGYAMSEDLFDPAGEPWFEFEQGKRLLHPEVAVRLMHRAQAESETPRKRDLEWQFRQLPSDERNRRLEVSLKARRNYGLPVALLRKDLNVLLQALQG